MCARHAGEKSMGRKRIDDRTRAEICMAVSEGMKIKDAARYFGVSEWTISSIRREEKEKNRGTENMQMTAAEICRDYREAKDRTAQVPILAELNATSVQEIEKILLADPSTGFKRLEEPAAPEPTERRSGKPGRSAADRSIMCSQSLFNALRELMGAGADSVRLTAALDGLEIRLEAERVK